jgi:hypothetical protein
MTTFWIHNISELFDKKFIMKLWPSENMSLDEKLNAISRLIILLTVVGFILTKTVRILVVGVVTLGVIVFLYYQKSKKEGMQNMNDLSDSHEVETLCQNKARPLNKSNFYPETFKNPFSNVLLPELNGNPNRKMAAPAFNSQVKQQINKNTQKMVQSLNPSNPDIEEKLFKDLGDNVVFDNSMIIFNSTANTRVPNDQNAFANFLYGNMPSCRDPSNSSQSIACTNNPPRIGQVYN